MWPPALQYQLPALVFVCVLIILFLWLVVVLFGEPKQSQERRLVDRKLVQAPSNLIAGCPEVVLLNWFFRGLCSCVVMFFYSC